MISKEKYYLNLINYKMNDTNEIYFYEKYIGNGYIKTLVIIKNGRNYISTIILAHDIVSIDDYFYDYEKREYDSYDEFIKSLNYEKKYIMN